MAFDIIVGRNESDKKKFGDQGAILLGKSYVQMGRTVSLSNRIFIDVVRSHIIYVVGKRGSGKSYSIGVIAEGIIDLPPEIKKNISIIILDTMGIYWTMKHPNEKDEDLLEQWGLKGKGLDVKIFTPFQHYKKYKEEGMPTDYPFSLEANDLTAEDWRLTFELNVADPVGVAIEKTLGDLAEKGVKNYRIDDLLKAIREDKEIDQNTKNAAINHFKTAKRWGLFSTEGTKIDELCKGGQVTVLDISCYTTGEGGWGVKSLVVGLLAKKVFIERMKERKTEELEAIQTGYSYFKTEREADIKERKPLVWFLIDECLPPNIEVITSKAHTPIKSIVERKEAGESFEVLAFDINKKEYSHKEVKNVFRRGKRDLLKIRTETGREIVSTPEHRVLTRYGFWSAVSVPEIGSIATEHYSKNPKIVEARLLGHLFGDGWASEKTTSLGFSGKKSDNDLEKIREDLKILGFGSGKIHTRKTQSKIKTGDGVEHVVNGISKSVNAPKRAFSHFKNLGAITGEKTLNESKIPRWLFGAGEKEKAEFLAAFMGSDGNRISQSSTAKSDFNPIRITFNKTKELETNAFKFANQIKNLFESLGIKVSRISKREGNIRKDKKETIKIVLTLAKSMDNTIKFLEKVNYRYCEEKEIEGKKWLAYLKAKKERTEERIAINKKIHALCWKGISKHAIAKKLGIPYFWVKEWTKYKRKIRASNLFPHFDEWINSRYKDNVIFEKVKSMELLEKQEVYDLETDELHNFVANGFIVHNCHEFLPKEGKTAATDALVTILREGRQPGVSLIVATQQPGKIHGDVMTQSDIVISHRITARPDVEALNSMTQSYLAGSVTENLDRLPRDNGAAIILDDNSERLYPIRVRPRFTWHGGESPTAIKVTRKLKLNL